MQVKVTRSFKCVPPGKVYAKRYAEGEIVEGRVAEVALSLKSGEEVKGGTRRKSEADKSEQPPSVVVRARLTKQHTIKDVDGKEVKLAKGIVVENDLAKQLIAEGVAEEIGADKT